MKRYLNRKGALHFVHKSYNKVGIAAEDSTRPKHTLLKKQATKKKTPQTPSTPVDEEQKQLLPDLPAVEEDSEDFDEVARQYLTHVTVFLDPTTNRVESRQTEILRFAVWDEITKSIHLCKYLASGLNEGDIYSLLKRVLEARKPNTMTHLDTMTALGSLKKRKHTAIAELLGEIEMLTVQRQMQSSVLVTDKDKCAAVLKACTHDKTFASYARSLSVNHTDKDYAWICEKLLRFEATHQEDSQDSEDITRERACLVRKSDKICPAYAKGHCDMGESCPLTHVRDRAFSAYPGTPKDTDWRKKAKCHKCGKKGHIAPQCKSKRRTERAALAKQVQAREYSDSDNEVDIKALLELGDNYKK